MSKNPTQPNVLTDDIGVTKFKSWTLYYHFRSSIVLTLNFEYKGEFQQVVEKGKQFCKDMNYRFIKIRPLIVDLDEMVKRRNEDVFYDENN